MNEKSQMRSNQEVYETYWYCTMDCLYARKIQIDIRNSLELPEGKEERIYLLAKRYTSGAKYSKGLMTEEELILHYYKYDIEGPYIAAIEEMKIKNGKIKELKKEILNQES